MHQVATGNLKIPVGKEPTDRKMVFILSVSIKPTEKQRNQQKNVNYSVWRHRTDRKI
jgi:hypothetical protein